MRLLVKHNTSTLQRVTVSSANVKHEVVTLLGTMWTVWTQEARLLSTFQSHMTTECVWAAVCLVALVALQHMTHPSDI